MNSLPPTHLPHTRGDEPSWPARCRKLPLYLPHTRGDEPRNGLSKAGPDVHLPHTRGDEPVVHVDGDAGVDASAPHAWG